MSHTVSIGSVFTSRTAVPLLGFGAEKLSLRQTAVQLFNKLYAKSVEAGSVWILDTKKGNVVGVVPQDDGPIGIAFESYAALNPEHLKDANKVIDYRTRMASFLEQFSFTDKASATVELLRCSIESAAKAASIPLTSSTLDAIIARESKRWSCEFFDPSQIGMPTAPETAGPHSSNEVEAQLIRGIVADLLNRREKPTSWKHSFVPPSAVAVGKINRLLLAIAFPGFAESPKETSAEKYGEKLMTLKWLLEVQVERCLRFKYKKILSRNIAQEVKACILNFLAQIPTVRRLLDADVRRFLEVDPSASSHEEIVLAYPGIIAIAVYRFANVLAMDGIPLLPRMMTEWSHSKYGIDIHPNATIGEGFVIDHGTSTVIGQTCTIGRNCTLYQGVTLGALSFPKDDNGELIRGMDSKRHPTLGDHVSVYANASVLGGRTTIGPNSKVGANVRITRSLLPETIATVPLEEPVLRQQNTIVNGEGDKI